VRRPVPPFDREVRISLALMATNREALCELMSEPADVRLARHDRPDRARGAQDGRRLRDHHRRRKDLAQPLRGAIIGALSGSV
jgi:hypothetical protein